MGVVSMQKIKRRMQIIGRRKEDKKQKARVSEEERELKKTDEGREEAKGRWVIRKCEDGWEDRGKGEWDRKGTGKICKQ